MPNANLIERLQGGNAPAQGLNVLPSIAPTTTGATVVLNQAGTAGIVTAAGAYLSAPSTSPSFGQNQDGFPFKVRVVGKVTTTASANITVAIQFGSSATAGSNTTIASTGAVAVNTASSNFFVEATLQWDGVSKFLGGIFQAFEQNGTGTTTVVVPAIITNQPISVATQNLLQFVVAVTTSSANNATFAITEFVMETV